MMERVGLYTMTYECREPAHLFCFSNANAGIGAVKSRRAMR